MRSFEGVLECFRTTFVDAGSWDYCIIWKSRDDSSNSRFIDWVDCCCIGGNSDADVKREKGANELCKDTKFKHVKRTKACQELAHFPSWISLSSGIHGDVFISNQPMWLTGVDVSTPNCSRVLTGTRVLIPISDGIVELFGTKHIPRDGEIIDFVIAQCNFSLMGELAAQTELDVSLSQQSLHSSSKYYLRNWPDPRPFKTTLQILPPASPSSSLPSCERSSSGSKPSSEHPYFDSHSTIISHEFFNQPIGSKNPIPHEDIPIQEAYMVSEFSNILQKDQTKTGRRQGKDFHSKNLVAERKRRDRIRDRLYSLRAVVPNISKMDRASIIGDAIDYIKELEENAKKLRNELFQFEHEDCQKNKQLKFSLSGRKEDGAGYQSLVHHDGPTSILVEAEGQPMEVQVEVIQINERDFLIKIFCKQKQGGILSLIEAIDSLGLQVVDVSITTFGRKVLNILHVEANKNDIQPKKLRDSLIKLTSREIR